MFGTGVDADAVSAKLLEHVGGKRRYSEIGATLPTPQPSDSESEDLDIPVKRPYIEEGDDFARVGVSRQLMYYMFFFNLQFNDHSSLRNFYLFNFLQIIYF